MKTLLISLCFLGVALAQESAVIIGGGPAGLSAAIWAARFNLKPLVIEGAQDETFPSFLVENYPGFPDGIDRDHFIALLKTQAKKQGARFQQGWVTVLEKTDDFQINLSDGSKIFSKAVIIATGRRKIRLGLEKEVEFLGKGIGICPLCEGPLYQGEIVAVTGDGEEAKREACLLSEWAKQVIVFGTISGPFPENVIVYPEKEVIELVGDELEGLTHLVIQDKHTLMRDVFETHGLFIAKGWTPNTAFLHGLLQQDEMGYILTKGLSSQTSLKGAFSAGDVSTKENHQLVLAVASGCRAALDIKEYLNHEKDPSIPIVDNLLERESYSSYGSQL
ncbi:MAG: FAD-dependent oxidoreductase [Chlamydiia bacterium]|nr:FAD-dependent oxidoreductase [Chlamydiia bacterium]